MLFTGLAEFWGSEKSADLYFQKVLVNFASETGPFLAKNLTPAFGPIQQGIFIAQAPGISQQLHWPRKK